MFIRACSSFNCLSWKCCWTLNPISCLITVSKINIFLMHWHADQVTLELPFLSSDPLALGDNPCYLAVARLASGLLVSTCPFSTVLRSSLSCLVGAFLGFLALDASLLPSLGFSSCRLVVLWKISPHPTPLGLTCMPSARLSVHVHSNRDSNTRVH
jgi:hypothetical protein